MSCARMVTRARFRWLLHEAPGLQDQLGEGTDGTRRDFFHTQTANSAETAALGLGVGTKPGLAATLARVTPITSHMV